MYIDGKRGEGRLTTIRFKPQMLFNIKFMFFVSIFTVFLLQFTVDDPTVGDHPLTTNEIKELLKDLKVLGKRELKTLITWRRNMKKILNFSERYCGSTKVRK